MTAPLALRACMTAGVELYLADDGTLCYRAPEGALTPELTGLVREHKADIIRLLGPHPPAICAGCGQDVEPGAPAGQGGRWRDGMQH